MPFAENRGANIYWEEQGQGTPILLIMGLGWTSACGTAHGQSSQPATAPWRWITEASGVAMHRPGPTPLR
jgi:hypothetical protein